MPTLTELTELAVHNGQEIFALRNRGERRIVPPWLEVYRAEELISVIRMAGEHGSRSFLAGAATAIGGFEADAAVLVSDSWVDLREIEPEAHAPFEPAANPDTGQPWELGEMSDYAREHPDQKVLREGMHVIAVNRAGDLRVAANGFYRWDPARRRIKFDDVRPEIIDPIEVTGNRPEAREAVLSGNLPRVLLQAMNDPSPATLMARMGVEAPGHEITDKWVALATDTMNPGFKTVLLIGRTPAERTRLLHELWTFDFAQS